VDVGDGVRGGVVGAGLVVGWGGFGVDVFVGEGFGVGLGVSVGISVSVGVVGGSQQTESVMVQ